MDDTEPNSTHLRDVSFSSYLTMVGENFTVNLPDPPRSPSLASTRGLQTPRRAQTQGGELDVFAAERYYNMGAHNEDQSTQKLGYINPAPRTLNPRNFTTPSVSSEASSWNSQSALMLANTKRKKSTSSNKNNFFSGLGCNGRSCSDKDSVVVVDHLRKPTRKSEVDPKLIVYDGTKQPLPRFDLRSPMSIASSSSLISEPISRRLAPSKPNFMHLEPDEVPRISLEVYGSSKVKKVPDDDVSVNLEKKLSMLTWDAIPKSQSVTAKTKSVTVSHDEIGSDASSDLFEIENISSHNGSSSQHQRIRRYEGMMTPTSAAYEPSEASIEWSVVTASAADFSGNNFDYDEKRLSENVVMGKKSGGGGQRSGILGCKSHKAVRVVEPAPVSSYRTSVPAALAGSGNDKLGTRSHLLH